MIRKFTQSCFVLVVIAVSNLFSQPTLQTTNIPGVGDIRVNKTITDTTIQPGSSGMGQVWNYSSFFVNPTALSETYVAPTGTSNDLLFPSANMKVNSYFGGDDYYNKTATELIYLGSKSNSIEIIMSNVQKLMSVPFAYGDSIVNQPVTGTGLLGYALEGTISVKADGTGDLTLYTNAYTNTLRVYTNINLIQGPGTGVDTYIHIERYTWYAIGFREPVFQISILDINGPLGTTHQKYITLRTITTGIENANLNAINFTINPNPTHNKTTVTLNLNRSSEVKIKVMDLTGRLWKEDKSELTSGLHSIVLDLSILPKGVYILSAESAMTSRQQRLIVD